MRIALILALALLAAFVAEPYVARYSLRLGSAAHGGGARRSRAGGTGDDRTVSARLALGRACVRATRRRARLDRPGRGRRGRADRHRLRLGRGGPHRHQLPRRPGRQGPIASRSPTGETVPRRPGRRRAGQRPRRAAHRRRASRRPDRRRQRRRPEGRAKRSSPSATRSASTRP